MPKNFISGLKKMLKPSRTAGMTPEQKRLETLLLDFIEKETKAEMESNETIPQAALALVELWKITNHPHNPCQ